MSDARSNLVIVRAGPNSLHQGWLSAPAASRSFDLVVSYYSEEAYEAHEPADGVSAVLAPGGKWDGLYNSVAGTGILDRYSHVWLPDDDIAADAPAIDRMFDLADRHGLAVCQPALCRKSHYSHFLLNHCAAFRLRYTNLIEVMVPCLSAPLLRRIMPWMKDNRTAYGLDFLWCRLPESGAFRAAVLDEVTVTHTRPVGSDLARKMAQTGDHAHDDARFLPDGFDPQAKFIPMAYAGIATDGTPVTGTVAMGRRMAASWRADLNDFADPAKARRQLGRSLRRHLVRPLDMSPLIELP